MDRVDVVQPALFGVMVALAQLWRGCGVEPAVVVGHSQGEIAAAYVAGGLSLHDAARLVVLRSRLLVDLMGRGGMASVALGANEVRERLEATWKDRLNVAALNGPASVVVSGEREALEGLVDELTAEGVRAREIPVGYASHSPQVEEIREDFLKGCAGITPLSGSVPFFSTVTGEPMDTAVLDEEYWYRNLRQPVLFEDAVRALLREGQRAFIELSPTPCWRWECSKPRRSLGLTITRGCGRRLAAPRRWWAGTLPGVAGGGLGGGREGRLAQAVRRVGHGACRAAHLCVST